MGFSKPALCNLIGRFETSSLMYMYVHCVYCCNIMYAIDVKTLAVHFNTYSELFAVSHLQQPVLWELGLL